MDDGIGLLWNLGIYSAIAGGPFLVLQNHMVVRNFQNVGCGIGINPTNMHAEDDGWMKISHHHQTYNPKDFLPNKALTTEALTSTSTWEYRDWYEEKGLLHNDN